MNMFEVPQSRLEELTNEIKRLTAAVEHNGLMAQEEKVKRLEAEECVRAMWPVFAAAIGYIEHRRASELKVLQELCYAMIQHGMEYDLLDLVIKIAETKGGEG